MTEFAVIAQAEKKELPTLAICRGNQVYNVYRGGTLKQHIDNHEDLDHRLTIDENADPRAAEIMRGIIGNETEGYSNHHQALDKVADNLNVVIRHDGDVEASMTLDGRVIALQFHPENYIFERREAVIQLAVNPNYQYPHHKGKRFFEHLISSARAIHHRATEDTEIVSPHK
jgi:putative glutamine amidotransferase